MPGLRALVALVVVTALGVGGWLLLRPDSSAPATYSVLDLGPMTAEDLSRDSYIVVPAMLRAVYVAFGETEEGAIYDTLAEVAAADALETLYLERAGAMAGGGLDSADQTIHEVELLNMAVDREGDVLSVDATWRVLGTVGHAEHMHVRGNVYSALLAIAPADGGWRITGFTLLDVDRSDAGTLIPAPAGGPGG